MVAVVSFASPRGECQKRIDARSRVDDRLTALDRRRGVLIRQDLGAEFSESRGELLVDGRKTLFVSRIQPGAPAHELFVNAGDHADLIGLQIGSGQRLVDGADALEQSLIKEDGICRCRQLGLPLSLERLIRGVGDALACDTEHALDAVERAAGSFHRGYRVFEGGRIGRGNDGVDLGAPFGKRFLERAGK